MLENKQKLIHKPNATMDILQTILNAIWVDGINLSHKKCIEALICSLLTTLSVNLVKLARSTFFEVKTLSVVRRIERLLTLKIFSVTAVGRAIVRTLPKQKKYILTMDRTTWELGKRVYNILAIGICYDGISIPIYFTAYDKRGATSRVEQISFMEYVLDIIPSPEIECVVADREFGNNTLIRWFEVNHISYCLRLREVHYVSDTAAGSCRKLKNILSSLAPEQSVILSNSYTLGGNMRVRIYAHRRKSKDEDSLLILATPQKSNFTDKIYRLRWQIETAFRALKSSGFNMEDTHLPLNGRFQNMLVIILIAYACAFIDGLIKGKQSAIPMMKRNGRRRFSIYSWGLDFVIADIRRTTHRAGVCSWIDSA